MKLKICLKINTYNMELERQMAENDWARLSLKYLQILTS